MTPPEQRSAVEALHEAIGLRSKCHLATHSGHHFPVYAEAIIERLEQRGYRLVPATEPAAPDTEQVQPALLAAARFMLDLIDQVYGTDNEGMDLPEEAEYRLHRAVIEAAQAGPPPLDVLAKAFEAPLDGGVSLYDLWSTGQYSFESPKEVAELIANRVHRLSRTGEPSDE